MGEPTDESKPPEGLPKAKIKKGWLSWAVWLLPAAALAFASWLIIDNTLLKGPTLTIYFKDGDGIDPGNTQIKCRGTRVGGVSGMRLTKDHNWAEVEAKLEASAKDLPRQGSLFWVVQPQLGVGGVKGLQTIMSGSFIEVRPGSGALTNHFIGSDQAPPMSFPGPALHLVLLAPNLSSLREQSPILYRGIQVGEVVHHQLGVDAQEVVIGARIRPEYAPLVRKNSVFWSAGGINVNLSLLHGLNLSAESAKALAEGAIEFATPDQYEDPAPNGTTFRLYENPLPEWKNWRPSIPLKLPPYAVPITNSSSEILRK